MGTRCTSCFGSFDLRLPGLADGDRPGRRPQAPSAQPRLSQRPFSPVYGLAAVLFAIFLPAALRPFFLFLGGMILATGLELVHRTAAGARLPPEVVGLF